MLPVVPGDPLVTVWDLVNFLLFDRDMVIFDVLTIIVIFVDGVSIAKPVALSFFLHWSLRSLGGIVFGLIVYFYQTSPYLWIVKESWPSIFWYTGELFLDSYPFQKAWAVATGKPRLRILALVGFVPLALFKLAILVFRFIDPMIIDKDDPDGRAYYRKLNTMDATVLVLSAFCDICCCIVIVMASTKSFGQWYRNLFWASRGKNISDEFMDSLVLTTEVRMIVCTVLVIVAAIMISLKDLCELCDYGSSARYIYIHYVYALYYLDYLILKYRKAYLINNSLKSPSRKPLAIGGDVSTVASLDPNQHREGTESDSILWNESTSGYIMDVFESSKGKIVGNAASRFSKS